MKLLVLQVLALCGLAALVAEPTVAQEATVCGVECVGPANACGWEAIAGKGTQAECDRKYNQCVQNCIKKNGGDKPYVYKPSPHPETLTTKPAAKKPANNFRGN